MIRDWLHDLGQGLLYGLKGGLFRDAWITYRQWRACRWIEKDFDLNRRAQGFNSPWAMLEREELMASYMRGEVNWSKAMAARLPIIQRSNTPLAYIWEEISFRWLLWRRHRARKAREGAEHRCRLNSGEGDLW